MYKQNLGEIFLTNKLWKLQVWDVLSNNEVVSIIWAAKSEEAAKAVVDAATAAWKHKYPSSRRDDCTVICLFFQSSLHRITKSKTSPSQWLELVMSSLYQMSIVDNIYRKLSQCSLRSCFAVFYRNEKINHT